jgi:single-strand DNA-binding protein
VASYNRIIIAGNLTRDPEFKQLGSGQNVTKLGIASNRQYKNRQTNALVQEVCFVDVDVFGPQAESSRQFLQKGSPVLVEGRLRFDTWQTPDGQTRSKHSIVADRIIFLRANGSAPEAEMGEAETLTAESTHTAPQQFEPARPRSPKKQKSEEIAAAAEGFQGGEFSFKDEPPFQDDLPF